MREDSSLGTLIGLCSELRDGFDEFCPDLEIVLDLEVVEADIVVLAAGASLSNQYKSFDKLAQVNMHIFDDLARGLIAKNYNSLIIAVSNPAEFAVDTFVDAGFHPERVIGFGAYLDTLRFRREIASELGVSRQHVSGLCLGKHGLSTVPCWSTVSLASICGVPGAADHLEKLKEEGLARLPRDLKALRALAQNIRELASGGDSLAATAMVNSQPPEFRASLRRYVSFFTGPVYPRVGIGEKVSQLISDILEGREASIAAQVRVTKKDNFLGIQDHAIGAPVVVSGRGARVTPVELAPAEQEAIRTVAKEVKSMTQAAKALRGLRRARKASGR
jgi:malate dehydrogenase